MVCPGAAGRARDDRLIARSRERLGSVREGLVMATAAVNRQQQSSAWWIFLLQGIAAILLGLMLITNPGATLVALTTFLGFYLLITGVLALVRFFVDRSTSRLWSLLSGIVGILAGVFVLNHPLLAAVSVPTLLIIILGVEALGMGVFEIIRGFQGGGAGAFILGVINVVIGLLLLGRPMATALAVPFIFAVLLLIEGVGLLISASGAGRRRAPVAQPHTVTVTADPWLPARFDGKASQCTSPKAPAESRWARPPPISSSPRGAADGAHVRTIDFRGLPARRRARRPAIRSFGDPDCRMGRGSSRLATPSTRASSV